MTDLEQYKAMLHRACLSFDEFALVKEYDPEYVCIHVQENGSPAGYSGFTSVHVFEKATGQLAYTGGYE